VPSSKPTHPHRQSARCDASFDENTPRKGRIAAYPTREAKAPVSWAITLRREDVSAESAIARAEVSRGGFPCLLWCEIRSSRRKHTERYQWTAGARIVGGGVSEGRRERNVRTGGGLTVCVVCAFLDLRSGEFAQSRQQECSRQEPPTAQKQWQRRVSSRQVRNSLYTTIRGCWQHQNSRHNCSNNCNGRFLPSSFAHRQVPRWIRPSHLLTIKRFKCLHPVTHTIDIPD